MKPAVSQKYDLEDRTIAFAENVKLLVKKLPDNIPNKEYKQQMIRSSGSVGANYIEANEALSRRDFLMRIRICRKEAKESAYWLRLVDTNEREDLEKTRKELHQEAKELVLIFGAILRNTEKKK